MASIEEQGRSSFHAHTDIWIDSTRKEREHLHDLVQPTLLEPVRVTDYIVSYIRKGNDSHASAIDQLTSDKKHLLKPKCADMVTSLSKFTSKC